MRVYMEFLQADTRHFAAHKQQHLNNCQPPRLSVNCVTACGDTVGKWRLVGVPQQTA